MPHTSVLQRLRIAAGTLKRDALTLYFAARDPRTPWYAKAFVGFIVAYALSPIDLIPDFIPVLGFLDELVLLPLALWLALRMIPAPVIADARARAERVRERLPRSIVAAVVIVALWMLALTVIGVLLYRSFA